MKKTLSLAGFLLTVTSLFIANVAYAATATVSTFTGGDAGEGLDLQGNFTYAVNVGPSGAAGKVGDATFTADNVAGVQVIAQNAIGTGGWNQAEYGNTENDNNLETVLKSIRWSGAPATVVVKLKVEKGIDYKLQLLFAEHCCPGRGFNVVIAGKTEVTNFMPGPTQAGTDVFNDVRTKIGVVITQLIKTATDELEIILDGAAADSPDITDHNAILNGFTLERLSAVTDNDKDGLRDDWEMKFFGNLNQGAADDPDKDGLTNLEEQTLGTDPTKADTDGDGLSDGDEVRKYKTDPLKKDTDGDGLEDGYEVNVLHTDPTKADTDGDGASDSQEIALGTDPLTKNVVLTSIGIIKGGDVGEGLDLDGNFIYALAIGATDAAAVKVRDANFLPLVENEVPGATLLAKNTIADWYKVNYGDSDNDKALAAATSSIRWSPAGDPDQANVVLTLEKLEIGAEYKIQLMFGEQCCNRGFDVFIDDVLIVKDFNPGIVQGAINNLKQEALITRIHFAKDTKVVIRLDGKNATTAFNDHNAILNAVTVEKLAGPVDSDNDGIPDALEMLYFGNLNQKPTDDPDKDGLTNAQEFAAGTDPSKADTDGDGLTDGEEIKLGTNPLARDTDGDGLSDGDEVKIYKTNPLLRDTDGDGLSDGDEVLKYKTNALVADSDGDGFDDRTEILAGTNPNDPASKPTKLIISAFTGGDKGEGLDLDGKFVYAVNVGTEGPAGKARDADFTADDVDGVTIDAINQIPTWHVANYGDSANDDVLELVMHSIRWTPAPNKLGVTLAKLKAGTNYKLQLLFAEECCPGRAFDVLLDGQLLVHEFNPASVQGLPAPNRTRGALLSYEFTATADTVAILLDGTGVTNPAYNDHNPILNGFTLEDLGTAPPPPAAFKVTKFVKDANGFSVAFESVAGRNYVLEYKKDLADATWQQVVNVNAAGTSTTLIDNNAGHRSESRGLWRIRTQ